MRDRGSINSLEGDANWKAPDTTQESSPHDNLRKHESTLFEDMCRSGEGLARVLAFITAFSVMTERGAFAKGDQPAPTPDKPMSSESDRELKRIDPKNIHGTADQNAQEKNIAYFADGKTLEILGRLGMTIDGNQITPHRDPQHALRYIEVNGVTTDSVSFASEVSGRDSTIIITGKNSDGSVDELRYVNGKFSSAESSAADSLGKPAYGK